jgi:hypothetical protein
MTLHEPDGEECRSAGSSGPSPEARLVRSDEVMVLEDPRQGYRAPRLRVNGRGIGTYRMVLAR